MEDNWCGENPYFLTIRHAQDTDGAMVHTVVDLDEEDWSTIHHGLMRKPGRWYLVEKTSRAIIMAMTVEEGDQPYYVARHVGMGSMVQEQTIQSEVIAYGMGRKHPNGQVERLWHFEDGLTVMGDDVNLFGIELVRVINTIKLAERQAIEEMQKQMEELQEQRQTEMLILDAEENRILM